MYIGYTAGVRSNFAGDVDEIMVWNSVLSSSTIAQHFQGNFAHQLAYSAGLLMWFKFSEGSGLTVTDVISGNVLTWQGSGQTTVNIWSPPAATSVCVAGGGVFYGYILSLSSTTASAGSSITVTLTQADQHSQVFMGPFTTTTVSLIPTGSATPQGTALIPISVQIVNGVGTAQLTDNIPETVTLVLADNSHLNSPTVVFSGGCGAGEYNDGYLTMGSLG